MAEQQHPGLTKSGRRKKPDKWANILKAKNEEYYALLRKVTELEDEQRSLRVKETLLLQVLDILQELVADAVEAPLPGSSPATHEPPADKESVMWLAIAAAVQQREQEIRDLYGGLLSSLYPPQQRQHDALDMLKVLCSPEALPVHSMSAEQLVARLSALAGKCALQLLQEPEEPSMAAHERSVSGPLYTMYLEFSSLIMNTMVWNHTKFSSIMNTNLDTQQPFEAPLPLQHWLDALQQLQLSEQQLHVLSCMHDQHYWTGLLSIKSRMDDNLQQQATHTDLLAAVLGQDSVSSVLRSASSSPTATGSPSTSAGAACVQDQSRSGRDPTLQATQVLESQEALVRQQGKLMRQWLLLGLHVAIVSTCTLSTYQLVRFVAACYPSIPRIDMIMYAHRHQRQQQAQQQQNV